MTGPKTLCEGRYKVKDVLGRSEHSTVYECYDSERDERVAVKVLSVSGPNPQIAREMFRREVGALKGFEHPHVVQMLDYLAEEGAGRLNIVLEVVPGGVTLEQLISKEPASTFSATLRWRLEQALGILQVLVRAHGRGIIHRDVKPRNVLLDREQRQLNRTGASPLSPVSTGCPSTQGSARGCAGRWGSAWRNSRRCADCARPWRMCWA